MSLVWYTVAELAEGAVINTHDYEYLNRRALSGATEAERGVEALLESVRVLSAPGIPPRASSIVVVPWPLRIPSAQGTGERFVGKVTYEPRPEAPGFGTQCYRVLPEASASRLMVDESVVSNLVFGWRKLAQDPVRFDMASEYWEGYIWRSPSYLLAGPVRIVKRCHEPSFVDEPLRYRS